MDHEFTNYGTEVASTSQASIRPTAPGSMEDTALVEALSDSDLLGLQDACSHWLELATDELQMRAEEQRRAKETA